MLLGNLYSQQDAEQFIYTKSFSRVFVDFKYPRSAEIWDIRSGVNLKLNDGGTPMIRWAFSDDEKYLATSDIDNIIKVWDPVTGKLLKILDGKHKQTIDDLLISPDSKRIIATDGSYDMVIWDIETGTEKARKTKFHDRVDELFFLPNSQWMISGSYNGVNKLWNSVTGELQMELKGHGSAVKYYQLLADGKRLLTASIRDKSTCLWNIETRRLVSELKGHKTEIRQIQVSPDEKYIITIASFDPAIRVYNGTAGDFLHSLPGHKTWTNEAIFSKDNKHLFTRGYDNFALYWNLETGEMEKQFVAHADVLTAMRYSPERNQLLTASDHVIVWDLNSSTPASILQGHTGSINNVIFGTMPGMVISTAEDNTIRLWDAGKNQNVQTFFPVAGSDFFSGVAGGYYKSSPGAAKRLHYVTPELSPVTFEQLDVKYNRPDKVLAASGYADTALMRSYRQAYEKRMKRLGIDTSAFNTSTGIPELQFSGKENIRFEQVEKYLHVHIKANDPSTELKTFQLWINESPLFGTRGLTVRRAKNFDTTLTIELSEGINILEASVTNTRGIESFRSPFSIMYRPEQKVKEKLYFIGIGIDKYQDSVHNLQWSVKDIRDLATSLKKKYGDNISIDTLFDKDVSPSNIKAIREKLLNTTVNDKVILSYSGHGLLNNNLDYYLSTYHVNFKKPELGGLPYEELERLMDSIPARRKLMTIDACHSGEVDKEEMDRYQIVERTEKDTTGSRSNRKPRDSETRLGMKSSFELMQELFINVSRSTGATIISAAAGTQFAQEKGELQNGVFTFSILEYMKRNSSATVTELKNYVNRRVPELTNGLQVPTTRSETKVVDWSVW